MKNKKGVSQVVAIVLILLITMSAFAIIVAFIVPYVRDSLNEGSECSFSRGFYKFYEDDSIKLNCYDDTNINKIKYRFSIVANSAEDLKNKTIGFRIVLSKKDRNSDSVDFIDGEEIKTDDIEGRISIYGDDGAIKIETPNQGEIKSYEYNGGDNLYESLEVYPILNSKKACMEEKQEIMLIKCK